MEKGAYTLLITPFREDRSIDEEALRRLVRRQMESTITGIAPLGTTGENSLLSDEEVIRVLEIVVDETGGRKPVLPDLCLSGTRESIDRAKRFADAGADFVVAFSPYLALPRPEGLLGYYEDLADASPVPLVLHSSKGRTGVELSPEMTARLAQHPNIVATKDGKKEIDHLAKIIYLTRNDDFLVFTGKDTTAYPMVAFGGAGSFTVAGNVVPDVMSDMILAALDGDHDKARKIHNEYYPLYEALRFETNPMAAKMALELMGLIHGTVRPPLTPLSPQKTQLLKDILQEKGLL